MFLTGEITEILQMLKNIQQSICQKLADSDYSNYGYITDVLLNIIPMGFCPRKVVVHNSAIVIYKCVTSDRLEFVEDRERDTVLNLLITLLNYWIAELIQSDNFLLGYVVDTLEVLIKSGKH